jgi:hypothetical protein
MEKRTSTITIRVTEKEKRELTEVASRFDVPAGFIVRRLIRVGLRDQGKQRLTLCADVTRRLL